MKKLLAVLLACTMILSLAACGSEAATSAAPSSAAPESAAAVAETPAETVAESPVEEASEATAETEDGPSVEEVYSMARKALDQQEIQNIMSWHVMYHCYGLHREEVEELWVQEPENQATASFGQNQGFYVGYDAIWKAYVEAHDTSWLTSAKRYCENNGIDISGMTDEEILEKYGGVGQLLLHVTTTSIIEVAEDGQTAKCFWYSPGMISETGQNANTIWEAYGVDFVKENGEWKIWHLHMFTDFMGSFYIDLGGNTGGMPVFPGATSETQGESGAQVAASTANAYLYSTQYTFFSADRLREDMEIFLPKPYESWSFDDGNYGPTREELESYNIDLDAWYAVH